MPAYEAYGQTDVLHDPKWLQANINARTNNGRRKPDQQAQEWMARLDQLQSEGGGAVENVLNTQPSVDQLLNTPAPAAGKSRYDTAMDQMDSILHGVIHGNTEQSQQTGGARPITSQDVAGAANSGGRPSAQDHLSNLRAAYLSPDNQALLKSYGGEAAYLSGPGSDPNTIAGKAYRGEPYVNGGQVYNAPVNQDYNTSTGEWMPSSTQGYFNGKPIAATATGQNEQPIKISSPAPNGVQWPELPSSAFSLGLNEKKDKDQLRFY